MGHLMGVAKRMKTPFPAVLTILIMFLLSSRIGLDQEDDRVEGRLLSQIRAINVAKRDEMIPIAL